MKHALLEILSGIDKDVCEAPDGWWETSSGSVFGARKLADITRLFDSMKSELEAAASAMRALSVSATALGEDYLELGEEVLRLREVVALSDDSRLADEHIKLEGAHRRLQATVNMQADTIYQLRVLCARAATSITHSRELLGDGIDANRLATDDALLTDLALAAKVGSSDSSRIAAVHFC